MKTHVPPSLTLTQEFEQFLEVSSFHRCIPSHIKPHHFHPHGLPEHARSAVLSREGKVCFELVAQARSRPRSIADATSGRGAHRRVTLHEANEAAPHGSGARDEER